MVLVISSKVKDEMISFNNQNSDEYKSKEKNVEYGISEDDIFSSLLPSLAEFALSKDFDSTSRSAAASCLYGVIAFKSGSMKDCPAKAVVTAVIKPFVNDFIKQLSSTNIELPISPIQETMNLLALAVSQSVFFVCFLIFTSNIICTIFHFLFLIGIGCCMPRQVIFTNS